MKLKLKNATLQWWKRVEEQRARQGKQKISSWEHMRSKLRKQFLPPDYAMELYKKFHLLRQNGRTVEHYTSDFNNQSIRVGLNETNEQLTSRFNDDFHAELPEEDHLECGAIIETYFEEEDLELPDPIYDEYNDDEEYIDIYLA